MAAREPEPGAKGPAADTEAGAARADVTADADAGLAPTPPPEPADSPAPDPVAAPSGAEPERPTQQLPQPAKTPGSRPRRPDRLAERETLPIARPPQGNTDNETASTRPAPGEATAETPLGSWLSSGPSMDVGHSHEVSGWGSLLLRRKSSFFRHVFFWLLGMSLLMSIGSGAIYYSRQSSFIEEDRKQRAELLLGYLANQSQLGAYAGDKLLLESPVRGMADQADVIFVSVYDATGRELIKTARSGRLPPEPPPGLLTALLRQSRYAAELKKRAPQDMLSPSSAQQRYEEHIEALNCSDLYMTIVSRDRGGADVAAYVHPSDLVAKERVIGVVRIGLSLASAAERLHEVVRWGVGLGLLLLGLGALAAYFIAGRISVPILELTRGADEIRGGNLTPRINVHRADELGTLAESFTRMAEQLRESMQALSRLNRDLESEVKRRTRQLRLAYAFTSVLNSPIDRSGDAMDAADLTVMLDQALAALVEATGTRGGGVFLVDDASGGDGDLLVRAAFGVSTHTLGATPSLRAVLGPRGSENLLPLYDAVKVSGRRLLVPLVFRNQPLGLLVLVQNKDEQPDPSLLEFVRQAAAQLAIAVSNARAFARVAQLAHELQLRSEALATQRDQLEQQSMQLRIQRNQLREVNRLKSEFLANVSHELRTPLNAIMGYSELIKDGLYGAITEDAHDAISGVLASSSNLLRLINQILDLSRIEAGKMDLHFEPIDVYAVVSAVIKEAEAMGRDRPYHVLLTCPRELRAETDPVRLQQILTNLVANAIKFTPQGSVEVEITIDTAAASPDTGDLLIAVRDTGIGIRPEHLELIFEEFRQVDGSSTRRFGGTGLGLAIARRLAEMLGASISVASAFGVGSTFTLRLPRSPSSRPTLRLAPRDGDSSPAVRMTPLVRGPVS